MFMDTITIGNPTTGMKVVHDYCQTKPELVQVFDQQLLPLYSSNMLLNPRVLDTIVWQAAIVEEYILLHTEERDTRANDVINKLKQATEQGISVRSVYQDFVQ